MPREQQPELAQAQELLAQEASRALLQQPELAQVLAWPQL
jgi:hypothetical protein